MGRKKKKQKIEETYFNKVKCYYCLQEYNGDQPLIKHQMLAHYTCRFSTCGKSFTDCIVLHDHMERMHEVPLEKVENAIESREYDTHLMISGMEGVPADADFIGLRARVDDEAEAEAARLEARRAGRRRASVRDSGPDAIADEKKAADKRREEYRMGSIKRRTDAKAASLAAGIQAYPENREVVTSNYSMAAAMGDSHLPPGWTQHKLEGYEGRTYYCHQATSKTQWELPRSTVPTAFRLKTSAELAAEAQQAAGGGL